MKQTLKYIYERLIEQMKFAEAKHSVSIALASALVVFSAAFLQNINPYITTLTAGSILFSLISILYSFIALSARSVRIRIRKVNKESVNLMYYKTIVKYDEEGYLKTVKQKYNFPKDYKPDEQDLDLCRQIIATAKVTKLKFSYFNLALTFLYLSLICEVVVIILMGGL